jgi:hypothetical protein
MKLSETATQLIVRLVNVPAVIAPIVAVAPATRGSTTESNWTCQLPAPPAAGLNVANEFVAEADVVNAVLDHDGDSGSHHRRHHESSEKSE